MRIEPNRPIVRWASSFAEAFDTAFGNKLLSWKCVWRSTIASLIAWLVVAVLNGSLPNTLAGHYVPQVQALIQGNPPPRMTMLGHFLLLNIPVVIVADFLSLCETRWMIRMLSRTPGFFSAVGVLVLDYFFSAAIFAAVVTAYFVHWKLRPAGDHPSVASVVATIPGFFDDELYGTLTWRSSSSALMPAGISTYFTSIWLWLYALSGALIRAASRVERVAAFLRHSLDVRNKPFTALAFVTGLLITVVFLIALPFVAYSM
jgi:hypothetical protein